MSDYYVSSVASACELEALPPMSTDPGEHESVASSTWIEGIFIEDRLQDNSTVKVRRLYGDIPGERYLEHSVELDLGIDKTPVYFSVEGAQQLGAALLRGAALVLSDMAENAGYKSEAVR